MEAPKFDPETSLTACTGTLWVPTAHVLAQLAPALAEPWEPGRLKHGAHTEDGAVIGMGRQVLAGGADAVACAAWEALKDVGKHAPAYVDVNGTLTVGRDGAASLAYDVPEAADRVMFIGASQCYMEQMEAWAIEGLVMAWRLRQQGGAPAAPSEPPQAAKAAAPEQPVTPPWDDRGDMPVPDLA